MSHTGFNHDIAGRQSVVTDRLGRVTVFGYDDKGSVLSQVAPADGVTSFNYDVLGNLLGVSNPLGDQSGFNLFQALPPFHAASHQGEHPCG